MKINTNKSTTNPFLLKNKLSLLPEAFSNCTIFYRDKKYKYKNYNKLTWESNKWYTIETYIIINNKIINQIVPKGTSKCSYSKLVYHVISIMTPSIVI